jgi:hypothetical protein
MAALVDAAELRDHVRELYREVAQRPGVVLIFV